MDRTGKIILVVSVLLLLAAPILQQKFSPPPKPLAPDANGTTPSTRTNSPGTNAPSPGTNAPIPGTNAPSGTNATVTPSPIQTNAPVVAPQPETVPEETATLENDFVRFTFTSRGGGVSKVELKKYPKDIAKDIAEGGVIEMKLDRGRLPLMALQKKGEFNQNAAAKRPYDATPSHFEILSQSKTNVVLSGSVGGRPVTKTFSLKGDYQLDASLTIGATTNAMATQEFYLHSGTAQDPVASSRMMGLNHGVMWFDGDEEHKVDPSWFDNKPMGCACIPGGTPRNNYDAFNNTRINNVVWAGAFSRFFAQAVLPVEPAESMGVHEFRLDPMSEEEAKEAEVKIKNNQMAWESAILLKPVAPGLEQQFRFTVYTGPREYDRLTAIGQAHNGNQFHRIMDFGGWFGVFAEYLLRLMNWMAPKLGFLASMKIGSYALAIIVITIIIKLIFWPLTAKSTRAMKKFGAVSAKMNPEMQKIREKYGKDPMKQQQKMMELWKKYDVSPFSSLGGCLPILIQIPVFIGFFTMLRSAPELRGAEFLWANDLSSPDTIATIAGFPINIMPLLMTGTMFLQMQLQPPSPGMDPTQQAIMKYMPLMFVVFFYSASSGLCLYWTVNNVLSIIQTKMIKVEDDGANKVEVIPPDKKTKRT